MWTKNQKIYFWHHQGVPEHIEWVGTWIVSTGEGANYAKPKISKILVPTKIIYIPVPLCIVKVEKILKGSLYLIPSPSPSVKTQFMRGKVCLRCKGKALLEVVNKLLKTKSLLILLSKVLPLHLKPLNFPANNLSFHWRWRWWDWIQATFKKKITLQTSRSQFFFSYEFTGNLSTV